MNKQEYLTDTLGKVHALVNDTTFKNSLAQVRARAIQEEYVSEQSVTDFRFNAKQIWRFCDFIFSESTLLLLEGFDDKETHLRNIKTAAQAFEFLAKFAEGNDRQTLLLNSAICYHIAGYQANASCLIKYVENERKNGEPPTENSNSNPDQEPDVFLTKSFLDSLLRLLRNDVASLQQISAETLTLISRTQEATTSGIADGSKGIDSIFELTAHAYFQQSLSNLVLFSLNGNQQDFLTSDSQLLKSHQYFERVGDVVFATITSELHLLLNMLVERSTWLNIAQHAGELLRDRVWQYYLRHLALERSIIEFWPSQLKAIHNHLLTSADSFVVQMPTSAGKTFIAELAILAALTSYPQSRCLYIAPYRALVNEIEAALSETLGAVGYRVSTLIGGFEFDSFQDYLITESDVLVATPEKVELLLRTHPEYFENLSTVVIDEGHILDEGIPSPNEVASHKTLLDELNEQGNLGRGILLEFLITRLKQRYSSRFIFLSAVMPEINAEDFVHWLCKQQIEPLRISRAERPSRQVVGKFEWRSRENGELEYISLPQVPPSNRPPFVHAFIQRKQYKTGELTPTGRNEKKSWPSISNKSQTTSSLAARMVRSGPVLVFCAQRGDVTNVISNLVTTFKYLEASDELPKKEMGYVAEPQIESYYQSLEWLGEEHPLTKALHYKIALHYGPLPDPVRQAIEDDFRNNEIQILVSTNTLGQGVNLPIRTAIIHSLERRWTETSPNGEQIPRISKLKKRDFWNVCGRAGRAGQETEGQIVFVVISQNDRILLNEYQDRNNIEEVESALYQLLAALIDKRINNVELIGLLDSQILALLAEEVINTEDEIDIRHFLSQSLVGIQAQRRNIDTVELVSTIRNLSFWINQQVPDKAQQMAFASTGLRVTSCQTLDEAVNRFLPLANNEFEFTKNNPTQISELFIRSAYEACRNLPEMQLARTLTYFGPPDEFLLLNNWINGRSIRELRTDLWDPEHSEDFSRYISDRITYKLPWGINGFLRILAFRLQLNFQDLPIAWQHLPAMFKFGVNNVIACWLCSLGITVRHLALQLSSLYIQETQAFSLDFSDLARWFVNLPNEFVLSELSGRSFDLQRIIKIRNQVRLGKDMLESIRNPPEFLNSPVRGIPYASRVEKASQVNEGDTLVLEPEIDNPYDPYAVRVLFEGEQIGYIQRDIAQILSRELLLGRKVQATASLVRESTETYPYPWIETNILFQ